MAQSQTEKSSYPSRYSPGAFVTAAQYIIELVCERKAAQNCVDLPMKFWKQKEWAGFFRSQLRKCHKLLKSYDAQAIIEALQDKQCKNVYSLFAPWLEDIIALKQKALEAKKAVSEYQQPIKVNREAKEHKQRPRRIKNNLLATLEEIDGEESSTKRETQEE